MRLTEDDLEFEWSIWGEDKPWWCSHCKTFLSSMHYDSCDGTDSLLPKSEWKPHNLIEALPPLTKEEFAKHLLEFYEQDKFDIIDVEPEENTDTI